MDLPGPALTPRSSKSIHIAPPGLHLNILCQHSLVSSLFVLIDPTERANDRASKRQVTPARARARTHTKEKNARAHAHAHTHARLRKQVLDSDRSGGLDSDEFCFAMRKLVGPGSRIPASILIVPITKC